AVLELAGAGLLHSAHDCAEGGLAVCLAESALADPDRPLGLDVALDDELPPAALLFGEAQGRIVISCAPADVARVLDAARRHGVPAAHIGAVGEPEGVFLVRGAGVRVEVPAAELADAYHNAIPRIMEQAATSGE